MLRQPFLPRAVASPTELPRPSPQLLASAALLCALLVERLLPLRVLDLLPVAAALAALAWHGPRAIALAGWALATLVVSHGEWSAAEALGPVALERTTTAALLFVAVVLAADRLGVRDRALRQEVERLQQRAFHDRLTDLPNRLLLMDRLAMAISQARRSHSEVAVLMIDLDGFKAVNDLHGHAAGDLVLKAVAQRLLGCVRATDTVARLGGDEFAVVVGHLEHAADALRIAEKILHAVAEPVHGRDGDRYRVGASIGISAYPQHGSEIDRLLARADAAMYESKLKGKHTLTFHADAPAPAIDPPWFECGEDHLVGVPEIDEQHRRLVWLCNELNRAVKAAEGEDGIRRRFGELVLFTRFHFATEERLMAAAGYADAAAHRLNHERLIDELVRCGERLEQGGELVALQTVKDWLLGHIDGDDRALGRHLTGGGR